MKRGKPSRWFIFWWTYKANRGTLPFTARVVNALIDALTRPRKEATG